MPCPGQRMPPDSPDRAAKDGWSCACRLPTHALSSQLSARTRPLAAGLRGRRASHQLVLVGILVGVLLVVIVVFPVLALLARVGGRCARVARHQVAGLAATAPLGGEGAPGGDVELEDVLLVEEAGGLVVLRLGGLGALQVGRPRLDEQLDVALLGDEREVEEVLDRLRKARLRVSKAHMYMYMCE